MQQADDAAEMLRWREVGKAEAARKTWRARRPDDMLKWVGAITLSGTAGIAIGVLASLFLLAPRGSTDVNPQSPVATVFAEQAIPEVATGLRATYRAGAAPEALDSAEIRQFLSRSKVLGEAQERDTLPTFDGVPVVTFASGAPAANDEQIYVVTEGESLWDIASRYGIGVEDLAKRNGLATDARIATGDTLVIPVGASSQEP